MTQATPPSQPTHGWPPPGTSGGSTRPATARRTSAARRWSRRLRLVALVAGLVALATGGGGGFIAARAVADRVGPTACGTAQCIPVLQAGDVLALLQERGFTCEFTCDLWAGSTVYSASVTSTDGLISNYRLDIRHDPSLPPGPRAMGLLTWFAVLPFGDDPEADEVTRQWLDEHVGGEDSVAIRGYEYRLGSLEPGHVRLAMQAWPAPQDLFESDQAEVGLMVNRGLPW